MRPAGILIRPARLFIYNKHVLCFKFFNYYAQSQKRNSNLMLNSPGGRIWTQFYDNNELLALAERIELPTYWLQINCTTWLCYASNIISAQLDSNQRFPVPKTGGVDQTPLCTASFLGGSSTTGLPALLVHFRSLPSGGLPSGGVQNLNWTMHWKL